MASILQNPESLLFSIKASWCICLVSHALALPILGFVMPLWTSFHLSCKLPFWRLLSWFLLLGQGSFLVFSIVFSLYLRAHLPHDFTVSGWLPNQYRRLSPHLYWIQISLFNHCLIRSLGSLLRHMARNEVMIMTFQNNFLYLSKGTTTHPIQTIHLEVILSPSVLLSICQ